MNKKATIFFSWQSDVKAAACRTLIENALENAVHSIVSDESVAVEPVVDRDTSGVPGCPDIGTTVFAKIDASAVFVADVTIINRGTDGRPMPNPNVLVELGYALKALGESRVLLVQNTALGAPELLPFDLRTKRAITYTSAPNAPERATERKALTAKLESALRQCLGTASLSPAVTVNLRSAVTQQEKKHHSYALIATMQNAGTRRIDDWELELQMPTAVLDGVQHACKVVDKSDAQVTTFRLVGRDLNLPLRPGDTRPLRIGFVMHDALYRERVELFARRVKLIASVDGEVCAAVEKPFKELQNY